MPDQCELTRRQKDRVARQVDERAEFWDDLSAAQQNNILYGDVNLEPYLNGGAIET